MLGARTASCTKTKTEEKQQQQQKKKKSEWTRRKTAASDPATTAFFWVNSGIMYMQNAERQAAGEGRGLAHSSPLFPLAPL